MCTNVMIKRSLDSSHLRLSSNKHFGHNIGMVEATPTRRHCRFYYKILGYKILSNLCNLACRSCGTWFSSNWYEDHKKLTGKLHLIMQK